MEENIFLQEYFKIIKRFSIKCFHAAKRIYSWKSNGMSEESIENITKSDSKFLPTFVDHYLLPGMNSNEHWLI